MVWVPAFAARLRGQSPRARRRWICWDERHRRPLLEGWRHPLRERGASREARFESRTAVHLKPPAIIGFRCRVGARHFHMRGHDGRETYGWCESVRRCWLVGNASPCGAADCTRRWPVGGGCKEGRGISGQDRPPVRDTDGGAQAGPWPDSREMPRPYDSDLNPRRRVGHQVGSHLDIGLWRSHRCSDSGVACGESGGACADAAVTWTRTDRSAAARSRGRP